MFENVSVDTRLAAKISALYDSLEEFEKHSLHLLMSVAVGGSSPEAESSPIGPRRDVWNTGIRVLSHINPAGLCYVGRPKFMMDYLDALSTEAVAQANIAHRTGPQELSPGGKAAKTLAIDTRLSTLVAKSVGFPVASTEITSYLYYNREGDHLYPHVDTEVFAINCIIMIKHVLPQNTDTGGSALLVWDKETEKKRIHLEAGEMAILLASGTVHAREKVARGEHIELLTIGFQKCG